MRIDNPSVEEKKTIFNNLDNYLDNNYERVFVKYLDLGVKVVRIINYSEDFSHLIEKQLNFVLRDSAPRYDATLKVFQDDDLGLIPTKIIDKLNPKKNLKLRVEMLVNKINFVNLQMFDKEYSPINPFLYCIQKKGILSAVNTETNTYYYGAKDLNPEEIIKEGHLFIQNLNKMLKSENTNIVHGASIGYNNNGVLFCARGQRGKSTLVVLSMMKGLEYVSDDYLTLEKTDEGLFAHPIYSIITLSPRMYNELFDELKESRFLFNNARKDKYVISIANFHDRFKKKYPIKFCMFPEIVSDKDPSIVECDKTEKGRAIVQLIQSTVYQMQDINNPKVIKKLFDMVKDFSFYKINLCNDISRNTEYLKEFLQNYQDKKSDIKTDRVLVDVTFDIANILDTETFTIYKMNKFATAIYENLLRGVSKEDILSALNTIENMPLSVAFEIDKLVEFLNEFKLLGNVASTNQKAYINPELVIGSKYKISVLKYAENETLELIK